MSESIRILILEDNLADAEIVQFELQEAEIVFATKVVMNEEEYLREIQEYCPDLILSDYDLPKYNGALALAEARRRCPDTPFILVTGAVGEDRAIEILTQGAKDYVLKSRLQQRLAPAVRRALAEAEEHRARKQAEAALREAHRTLEERVKIRTAELEAEIAARKKSEEARRESEHYYRELFNSMQEGFYIAEIIYDGDGKPQDYIYLDINPVFETIMGRSRDQIIGKRLKELVPDVSSHWLNIFKRVALTGTPIRSEFYSNSFRRHFKAIAYRPIEGQFAVLVEDISESKRIEEELRKSEERFRSYFELGLIGMAITSPTNGIIEVNDKICEILGYERSEFLKLTWAEITHADDLVTDQDYFNRILAGEIDGYSMDKRFVRKNGDTIDATISVKCIRAADGSVDYLVALLQDITERKRAEQALRESEERFRNSFQSELPRLV